MFNLLNANCAKWYFHHSSPVDPELGTAQAPLVLTFTDFSHNPTNKDGLVYFFFGYKN